MPASDSQFDDRQLEQLLQSALQQQARPAGEDVQVRHLTQIVEAAKQLPDAAVSDPALRRLPWWRRQLARGSTMLSTNFRALAAKAVAAATVTMMATGGVAAAGELPASAQDAVSDVALEVGVDLPTAAEVQLEDELAAFTTELEIGVADATAAEDTGSELDDSEESAAEVVAADGRRQFGVVFSEKVSALQQDCAARTEAASSRELRRQVRADCRTQMKELRGELRQARRTMAAPGVARIVAGEIGSDRARAVHAVLADWHQTRQDVLAALHAGELTEEEAEALLQDAARQKAAALAQDTDEPAARNEADTDAAEEADNTRPAHAEERRDQRREHAEDRREQRREHAEERREQRREHAEDRRSTSDGDPDAQRDQAERHRDERQQLRERHAEQRRETRPSRPAHANGSSGGPQEADEIDDSDESDESDESEVGRSDGDEPSDGEPSEDSDVG